MTSSLFSLCKHGIPMWEMQKLFSCCSPLCNHVKQDHCVCGRIRLCHRRLLVVSFPLWVYYKLWLAQLRSSGEKGEFLHLPTVKKVMSFFLLLMGFLPLYCSYLHGHNPPAELLILVYILFHSVSLKRVKNSCRILVWTSLNLFVQAWLNKEIST